jgi:cytochrome c556
MMKSRLARLFMWMGATAAMTYYLDPERGEKRRKDLRKRLEKMRKMGRKARLQVGL